jgi:hypothetical protein
MALLLPGSPALCGCRDGEILGGKLAVEDLGNLLPALDAARGGHDLAAAEVDRERQAVERARLRWLAGPSNARSRNATWGYLGSSFSITS